MVAHPHLETKNTIMKAHSIRTWMITQLWFVPKQEKIFNLLPCTRVLPIEDIITFFQNFQRSQRAQHTVCIHHCLQLTTLALFHLQTIIPKNQPNAGLTVNFNGSILALAVSLAFDQFIVDTNFWLMITHTWDCTISTKLNLSKVYRRYALVAYDLPPDIIT